MKRLVCYAVAAYCMYKAITGWMDLWDPFDDSIVRPLLWLIAAPILPLMDLWWSMKHHIHQERIERDEGTYECRDLEE